MKKQILCLMIACLSLFAFPASLSAGSEFGNKDKTENVIPIVPPAMEKKVNEFKKNHPEMFSKKENKESNNATSEAGGRHGGVYYISGGALLLIIILLIILL